MAAPERKSKTRHMEDYVIEDNSWMPGTYRHSSSSGPLKMLKMSSRQFPANNSWLKSRDNCIYKCASNGVKSTLALQSVFAELAAACVALLEDWPE